MTGECRNDEWRGGVEGWHGKKDDGATRRKANNVQEALVARGFARSTWHMPPLQATSPDTVRCQAGSKQTEDLKARLRGQRLEGVG